MNQQQFLNFHGLFPLRMIKCLWIGVKCWWKQNNMKTYLMERFLQIHLDMGNLTSTFSYESVKVFHPPVKNSLRKPPSSIPLSPKYFTTNKFPMLFRIHCFENRSQKSANSWFCLTLIERPFFSDALYISLILFSKITVISVSSIFCTAPSFSTTIASFSSVPLLPLSSISIYFLAAQWLKLIQNFFNRAVKTKFTSS